MNRDDAGGAPDAVPAAPVVPVVPDAVDAPEAVPVAVPDAALPRVSVTLASASDDGFAAAVLDPANSASTAGSGQAIPDAAPLAASPAVPVPDSPSTVTRLARTAAPAGPSIETPSADVELAADASPLPGTHRGGFSRLPTAPIGVTSESAPSLEPDVQWASPAPPPSRGLAAWGLGFAIVGLVVSFFVGWGFPLGVAAIVSGILALRRPLESRAVAIWVLAIGMVSIGYSALWLAWAATRANLFG